MPVPPVPVPPVPVPPVPMPPVPMPPVPPELLELVVAETHWLLGCTSAVPQAPQLTVPPQPSGTVPQLAPAGQVVFGVQPHDVGLAGPAAAGLRARRRCRS